MATRLLKKWELEYYAPLFIQREMDKRRKEREDRVNYFFVELNNLYLSIERGETSLTIHSKNRLFNLLERVYPAGAGEDVMREYWWQEFQLLPNWINV